jgi:hypothetical protein
VTSTEQHPGASPDPAPRSLRDLVGEPRDFFSHIWNVFPYQYRVQNALGLLSPADIWDELDCGLIVRPYVRLADPSGAAGQEAAFHTRLVVNNELTGYPDPDAFSRAYRGGATIVLERPELWHARVAGLVGSLAGGFRGEVWSAAVLTPPRGSIAGLVGQPGREHSFALQLAGRSSWSVGGTSDGQPAPGSFCVELDAGGLVYLPPDCERAVRVGDEGALLLVISVAEVSAERLAETIGVLFLRSPAARSIEDSHHTMTIAEKIAWLRGAIAGNLAEQDPQEALKIALRYR